MSDNISRVIVWFSCGAASAIAAKLAIAKCGDRAEIVYCDTMASEHPDHARFMADVEKWLGRTVTRIRFEKYASIDDVFEKRAYMSGVVGAICTVEMKKVPRFNFQQPDDLHIFWLTVEEEDRIQRFTANNPELELDWILRDKGISKDACLYELSTAGIQPSIMYALGFANSNCLGCVKATSPGYWAKVREHFPEVFARRCQQSRRIGVKLIRIEGERRFLDELPQEILPLFDFPEDLSCGPQCAGGQS